MAEWGRGMHVFYLLNGNENKSFFLAFEFCQADKIRKRKTPVLLQNNVFTTNVRL